MTRHFTSTAMTAQPPLYTTQPAVPRRAQESDTYVPPQGLKLMMKHALAPILACVCYSLAVSSAYTPSSRPQPSLTRRDFANLLSASSALVAAQPAVAFDGSGSSAYSGKSVATKLNLRKSYQARVAADVRDFNALGAAIVRGETDTDPWIFFFAPLARRQPDSVGRTYAALADLVGHIEGRELVGGDGYLLASTFTKAGKPPENTPAVKSYTALSKAFDPIKAAGGKGDATKAKAAWEKAAVLFSKYLEDVEMPGDLTDPLYK